MKTHIILAALVALAGGAKAQSWPKQHVYYDTIKTVKERVDYSPDTIPVFFKELIINGDSLTEQWTAGFVVWQTYVKKDIYPFNIVEHNRGNDFYIGSSGSFLYDKKPYYKDEYRFTESDIPGKFLYKDKTPVKNPIIRSLKR